VNSYDDVIRKVKEGRLVRHRECRCANG
jgi:hypothetical protein